jgi:soluble lytic murein transglycosylase-like protein
LSAASQLCTAEAQRSPGDARSAPDPELRKILVAAIADADSFDDRFDAEVWLTDMSRRLTRQVPDAAERMTILKAVHRHATQTKVEPELVLAVIDSESTFDRFAISSASALGLMQVMPFWVPELGYKDKNQLSGPGPGPTPGYHYSAARMPGSGLLRVWPGRPGPVW